MMRLTAYASASTALAVGVLVRAIHERANFFSASIYLSQSKACVIISVNLLILLTAAVVFTLQRVLYGPLRPVEAEQLYDKAWFAITETCLAMTVFREEIGVWFIVLFTSLLVGKVWAWIGEGRVEILDQQPPANPRLFHARLSVSLLLSLIFDIYLLNHSISTVRRQAKPTMMVMFAFEFAVLITGSTSTALRYLISLQEAVIIRRRTQERLIELRALRRQQNEGTNDGHEEEQQLEDVDELDIEQPEWEEKSRWILYLELLTDFVRLILYLVFFVVLCVFYGMPLHIIRDVAIALRSFHKRLTDFIKYKNATRDMNERYVDATSDDIGESDVCIVCREVMRPWRAHETNMDQRSRPKKLPCGHTLHFGCLRRWLQWQQNCPTCRQPVISETNNVSRTNQPPNPPTENAPINHDAAARVPDQNQNRPGLQRTPTNGAHASLRPDEQTPPIRNRWRRFQLGSLTVDVGAWRGVERPALTVPSENNLSTTGIRNDRSGFDATAENSDPREPNFQRFTSPDVRMINLQIDALERQISSQITGLRSTMNDLEGLQRSYGELLHLHDPELRGTLASAQVFRSDHTTAPLSSGSTSLPEGLVIPEGWTLVPLSRAEQASNATAASGITNQTDVESNTSPLQDSVPGGVATHSTNQRPSTARRPPNVNESFSQAIEGPFPSQLEATDTAPAVDRRPAPDHGSSPIAPQPSPDGEEFEMLTHGSR